MQQNERINTISKKKFHVARRTLYAYKNDARTTNTIISTRLERFESLPVDNGCGFGSSFDIELLTFRQEMPSCKSIFLTARQSITAIHKHAINNKDSSVITSTLSYMILKTQNFKL